MIYVQPNQLRRGEGHILLTDMQGERMAETPRPWARPNEKMLEQYGICVGMGARTPKSKQGARF